MGVIGFYKAGIEFFPLLVVKLFGKILVMQDVGIGEQEYPVLNCCFREPVYLGGVEANEHGIPAAADGLIGQRTPADGAYMIEELGRSLLSFLKIHEKRGGGMLAVQMFKSLNALQFECLVRKRKINIKYHSSQVEYNVLYHRSMLCFSGKENTDMATGKGFFLVVGY
jgi:hypothetical protein